MLATKLYAPTLREVPSDADVVSQQLMLRAGFMRKTANGLYSFLPLGWRSIKKIEAIVREEMDRASAQEIMMPILQPAEIWKESGRWNAYGAEMMRINDRHDNEFCLGPTHEEMITTLVKNEINSYRQLPVNLYQIQTPHPVGASEGKQLTRALASTAGPAPSVLADIFHLPDQTVCGTAAQKRHPYNGGQFSGRGIRQF